MNAPEIVLRFYGNLNDFLPQQRRHKAFKHSFQAHSSIKDTLESIGVPHPEIDLILVNGHSTDFSYLPKPSDVVEIYPQGFARTSDAVSKVRPQPLATHTFVLDVHLGKLARYLRFLGFDALYRNDYADEELAEISSQQQRVLLTQDLGLLKRSIVTYGYRVRSSEPKTQVGEILSRYSLYNNIVPFRRCSRCNGLLASVEKADVAHRLPYYTALHYETFFQCQSCEQVYWKGAHYQKMNKLIETLSKQDTEQTNVANP